MRAVPFLLALGVTTGLTFGLARWVLRQRGAGRKQALLWTLGLSTLVPILTFLGYLAGSGPTTFLALCRQVYHTCATWVSTGARPQVIGGILAAWTIVALLRVAWRLLQARRLLERLPTLEPRDFPGLHRALRRARSRAGLTRKVRVHEYPTPRPFVAVLGIGTPRLLLSRALLHRLSEAELEAVFLHEFGHLKSRDPLWNLLALFFRYWLAPLPFARHLYEHFVEEMEFQVDGWTVERLGSPVVLAEALVKASGKPTGIPQASLAFAEARSHLGRRLQALLQPPKAFPLRRFTLLWSGLLALSLLLGYSVGHLQAHQAPGLCLTSAPSKPVCAPGIQAHHRIFAIR